MKEKDLAKAVAQNPELRKDVAMTATAQQRGFDPLATATGGLMKGPGHAKQMEQLRTIESTAMQQIGRSKAGIGLEKVGPHSALSGVEKHLREPGTGQKGIEKGAPAKQGGIDRAMRSVGEAASGIGDGSNANRREKVKTAEFAL